MPNLSTALQRNSQQTPSSNLFSGDSSVNTAFWSGSAAVNQLLPWGGASYDVLVRFRPDHDDQPALDFYAVAHVLAPGGLLAAAAAEFQHRPGQGADRARRAESNDCGSAAAGPDRADGSGGRNRVLEPRLCQCVGRRAAALARPCTGARANQPRPGRRRPVAAAGSRGRAGGGRAAARESHRRAHGCTRGGGYPADNGVQPEAP